MLFSLPNIVRVIETRSCKYCTNVWKTCSS